jgi:4-alpha-glucanotransferase
MMKTKKESIEKQFNHTQTMKNERSSGILLHITSLPGNYGIGTMGKEAFEFVDF